MFAEVTDGPEEQSVPHNAAVGDRAFAILKRDDLIGLSHTMPDAQSAVLLCLSWQAALQERLNRGPHAGMRVARLSGLQLAKMTGRPLRTIRDALSKLRGRSIIEPVAAQAGRTAVYRLKLDGHLPPREMR